LNSERTFQVVILEEDIDIELREDLGDRLTEVIGSLLGLDDGIGFSVEEVENGEN